MASYFPLQFSIRARLAHCTRKSSLFSENSTQFKWQEVSFWIHFKLLAYLVFFISERRLLFKSYGITHMITCTFGCTLFLFLHLLLSFSNALKELIQLSIVLSNHCTGRDPFVSHFVDLESAHFMWVVLYFARKSDLSFLPLFF